MISSLGDNIIFVISQPRAGSTLLQRILGSHPDIHTVSEPWLMLHPLYMMRTEGFDAEYNGQLARVGVESFFKMLPGGEEDYVESLRRMYVYLYQRALSNSGKSHFLDKTPRYYFVIPELSRIFPHAHYIILFRNPLAVLCSIFNNWTRANWFLLHNLKPDLIQAPRLLLEGVKLLGDRGEVVHYEQLLKNPESVLQGICKKLGIGYVPDMVEYGRHGIPPWSLGDQEGIYKYTRPSPENSEKWIQALDDPQVWRLSNDYLQLLGHETLEHMGYSFRELRQMLEAYRSHRVIARLMFSLSYLLKKPLEDRKKWEHGVERLARSLRQKGLRGTVFAAMQKSSTYNQNEATQKFYVPLNLE